MKKVKKRIEKQLLREVETTWIPRSMGGNKHSFVIEVQDQYIEPSKVVLYLEDEEPETIKEFLEHHDIKKSELLEWLNKNYKKDECI